MIDVLKEISGAVLFDEQILMKFVGKQKLCKVNKTTGVKKQTQPLTDIWCSLTNRFYCKYIAHWNK